MKSGSARQPLKSYIYGAQLAFLKKITERRPTDDSITHDTQEAQAPEDSEDYDETCTNTASGTGETPAEDVRTFRKPATKKKREPDPLEQQLISAIKQRPDRHVSFFHGIIPTLERFDDDEIVEFQLKMLETVSDIKKRQKSSANVNPVAITSTIPTPTPSTSHDRYSPQSFQYNIPQPRPDQLHPPVQYYEEEVQNIMESASTSSNMSDHSETSKDSFKF